jgi:hypothetical protein
MVRAPAINAHPRVSRRILQPVAARCYLCVGPVGAGDHLTAFPKKSRQSGPARSVEALGQAWQLATGVRVGQRGSESHGPPLPIHQASRSR